MWRMSGNLIAWSGSRTLGGVLAFLVLALGKSQAAECEGPKRRDSLPAMEGAQIHEVMADALDRAARACTLDTVGCDEAKERCRTSAQLIQTKKSAMELE